MSTAASSGTATAADQTSARTVAIIMDGNGRWANARGLPVDAGHREGTRALRRTVEAAIDLGVTTLAVYAFSTENWSRPPDEVAALMVILGETIDKELPDLAKQGVRTRFFGRRDRVPADLRARMADLERKTEDLVKNGEVGDDEERRAEAQVQKLTDDNVKTLDEMLKHKEAEIMEV